MLAAVIMEKKFDDISNSLKKRIIADLIELRLDYLEGVELSKLQRLIKQCKKPLIVTNRKKDEGGFFNGSEVERIQLLTKALELGADYIDIEYSSNEKQLKKLIKNKKKSRIIISYHNFKETPKNIKNIYDDIKKLNANIIKIVTYANSVTDNFRILGLIKIAATEKKAIVAFCTGPYGEFSRILSIIVGSQITYGSIERGKESASGQLSISEMTNNYRIKKLNKNTKISGVIGNPVEHSWSPIMHNAAFDELNINAVFLKFKVDNLNEFIDYFKKQNILGFSITIPHKLDIMKYLDKIDVTAKEIGAVNTVAVEDKKLIGYNTDCYGAIQALKARTGLNGKNIVVLGAGGTSRAIVYGLVGNKANVTVLNRTLSNARKSAEIFGCEYGSLEDLKKMDYDVLINTTPVGMHPDLNSSPLPLHLIKNNSIVFDVVFNPFKTKLLQYAQQKGCRVIPGIEMLIHGNAMQFKLWTGKNAPIKLMRKSIMKYIQNASH